MDQPVVRHKIALMANKTEALTAYTEATCYQLSKMSIEEGNARLGGQAALLKALATATIEFVSNEAVKLLGGIGITKGGAGERVEMIFREFKALQIPGGSEDVMLDLGVRQALKEASKL